MIKNFRSFCWDLRPQPPDEDMAVVTVATVVFVDFWLLLLVLCSYFLVDLVALLVALTVLAALLLFL